MNLKWGMIMKKKREILVEGLKRNVIKVTFTKVNGDERIMNCTLHDSVLPESNGKSKKKENLEVLSVWDIDKDAWRSFRIDSVKEIKVVEGVLT